MVHALGLVRNLQGRAAHPEVHGVHINLPWIRFGARALVTRLGILVDGHRDVDLLGSSLSD